MTSLRQIQQDISDGHFDAALTSLQALPASQQDNHDALYMQAVCLRYLYRFDEAHACLQRLKRLLPEHGRTCQEEGHLLRDAGMPDAAVIAYRRACQYNPALTAAWRSLADGLEQINATGEAAAARAQLKRLQDLPPILVAVTDLIAEGKLLQAEDRVRQFLLEVPHHVEAMRLLAAIGIKLGALDDAEYLLESACEFEPDNIQARMDYIQALRKQQRFAAARAQAKLLLDKDPHNPRMQSLYAVECMHGGDFRRALDMLDKVLTSLPADPVTLTSRGHVCKTTGDFDAAVRAYRDALHSRPSHGEAYYSLANLKTYRFRDDEIAAMNQQADGGNLSFMQQVYLSFALGKACEDRGEYEQSFRHYAEGNQLKKTRSNYSADKMSSELGAQITVCNEVFFTTRGDYGHPAADPIFIVGLPRAGSTLLEQILSSHSQVDGTLELPNIPALSQRLRRQEKITASSRYPHALTELNAKECADFGAAYINDTRIHRQQAAFFIDKMPNNFRHIGLIKLILPNAKIIDARRDPMACCFSGFRQLFAEGQEFSYSLADIGHYYRDYVQLMQHWNRILPGQILTVRHEDVVADLETQVRRMLDYCELPFEQACVEYYKTERNIRTPSSEQVRQPVFRSGLDNWRNFEPWLQPLKQALGDGVG
ncbi:MAG: tetratricopeptide repeat-containing sulfotransferase family protein [Gammaproteobacteria bacterium]